jgi:hypothetical protein
MIKLLWYFTDGQWGHYHSQADNMCSVSLHMLIKLSVSVVSGAITYFSVNSQQSSGTQQHPWCTHRKKIKMSEVRRTRWPNGVAQFLWNLLFTSATSFWECEDILSCRICVTGAFCSQNRYEKFFQDVQVDYIMNNAFERRSPEHFLQGARGRVRWIFKFT